MSTPNPRVWLQNRAFRLARRLLVAALALLPAAVAGGCKSMPYEGPGEWYVGKAEVTGDAKMFGPGGPTSIMFQLPQGTTNWIWRVSTGGVTREWVVERRYQNMSHLPDEPEVWWMGDSTGSWSGTMRNSVSSRLPMVEVGDHAGGAPPFRAYTIDGVPSNGDGRIEGKGQKVSDEIFVTMQWIKPDGSVGAQWKYSGLGRNEQEYLQSLKKMGAEPPKVVEPYPQRSP